MAKVVAIVRGYFGGVICEQGDVFEWPDDVKLGSWVKPADGREVVEADAPEPGPEPGGKKRGRPKAETVQAPTAVPFADAPEPVRVKSEINDALGSTQPDWIEPGQPVMSDE